MERIKWIDRSRGLAILLVILGHIIGGLEVGIGGGNENIIRQILYAFHMPLIFAVSGAVSDEERIKQIKGKKECVRYLGKCTVNLYVTYLFFGYLFWAVKYFLYQGNEPVTAQDALRLPFDYSAWIPGWYLLALLVIKWLDFFMIKGMKSSKIRVAVWIFLFLAGNYMPASFLARAFKNGLYFQLGRRWKKGRFENPEIIAGILAVAGVLKYGRGFGYVADFFIAVSLCEMAIMLMIQTENKPAGFLEQMGAYSMAPYVLHAYFTIPVKMVLNRLGCQSFPVFVLSEFTAAALFSYLTVFFMKKYPCLRRLFYPL